MTYQYPLDLAKQGTFVSEQNAYLTGQQHQAFNKILQSNNNNINNQNLSTQNISKDQQQMFLSNLIPQQLQVVAVANSNQNFNGIQLLDQNNSAGNTQQFQNSYVNLDKNYNINNDMLGNKGLLQPSQQLNIQQLQQLFSSQQTQQLQVQNSSPYSLGNIQLQIQLQNQLQNPQQYQNLQSMGHQQSGIANQYTLYDQSILQNTNNTQSKQIKSLLVNDDNNSRYSMSQQVNGVKLPEDDLVLKEEKLQSTGNTLSNKQDNQENNNNNIIRQQVSQSSLSAGDIKSKPRQVRGDKENGIERLKERRRLSAKRSRERYKKKFEELQRDNNSLQDEVMMLRQKLDQMNALLGKQQHLQQI